MAKVRWIMSDINNLHLQKLGVQFFLLVHKFDQVLLQVHMAWNSSEVKRTNVIARKLQKNSRVVVGLISSLSLSKGGGEKRYASSHPFQARQRAVAKWHTWLTRLVERGG